MSDSAENIIVPEKTVSSKAKLDSLKMKEQSIEKMMRMLLDGFESDLNFH